MQKTPTNAYQIGYRPEIIKKKLFWAFTLIRLTYFIMLVCAIVCLLLGIGAVSLIFSMVSRPIIGIWPFTIAGLFAAGGFVGCYSILRGFFAIFSNPKGFVPAYRISTSAEVELMRFVMDICSKVGARSPNTILIHAEPTAFVSDSQIQVTNGKTTGRTLTLGLPFLYVLSVDELRAVLAHEFAHFVGADVEASKKIGAAFEGIVTAHEVLSDQIASRESISMCLPLLLPRAILSGCLVKLIQTTASVSQSQELRADMIAAHKCGGKTFTSALIKTASVGDYYFRNGTFDNIQAYAKQNGIGFHRALREKVSKKSNVTYTHSSDLDNTSSIYSTHPSLKTRVENIYQLPEHYNNHEPALSFFTHLEEYETAMDNLLDSTVKLASINRREY